MKIEDFGHLFNGKPNEAGRAPLLRHLPAQDVLMMERVRATDVGYGPGVADGITNLLAASSKNEAKKLAKRLVITGQELFDLVHNCGAIGFVHGEDHRRDTPEGRSLSSEDRVAIYRGAINDGISAKIRDGYREQRHLSWHTFTSTAGGARWHCFFYEHRDVHGEPLSGDPQSRDIGPHLHYSSYLFHATSLADFVQQMKPGFRVPHDTHIAFRTSFTEQDLVEADKMFGEGA